MRFPLSQEWVFISEKASSKRVQEKARVSRFSNSLWCEIQRPNRTLHKSSFGEVSSSHFDDVVSAEKEISLNMFGWEWKKLFASSGFCLLNM